MTATLTGLRGFIFLSFAIHFSLDSGDRTVSDDSSDESLWSDCASDDI